MKRRPPRKRRTRAHVISDLSLNSLERIVLQSGHTIERVRSDYGIDAMLFFFDRGGFAKPGTVAIQLKATDHPKWTHGGRVLTQRVDSANAAFWAELLFPVILIVYDAKNENAYWVHVQSHFDPSLLRSTARRASVTIGIPRVQHIDANAIAAWEVYNDLLSQSVR